jgi:hypothetical protein
MRRMARFHGWLLPADVARSRRVAACFVATETLCQADEFCFSPLGSQQCKMACKMICKMGIYPAPLAGLAPQTRRRWPRNPGLMPSVICSDRLVSFCALKRRALSRYQVPMIGQDHRDLV